MREIKFRAWETKEKRMLHNGSFDVHLFSGGSDYGISHNFMDESERQYRFTSCKNNNWNKDKPEVILLQFTGLKDKNGKDIYEGDIIQILYTDWCSPHTKEHHSMGISEYKKSISRTGICVNVGYKVYLEFKNEYTGSIHEGKHGEKEVIGNIYENPELLEKGGEKK